MVTITHCFSISYKNSSTEIFDNCLFYHLTFDAFCATIY